MIAITDNASLQNSLLRQNWLPRSIGSKGKRTFKGRRPTMAGGERLAGLELSPAGRRSVSTALEFLRLLETQLSALRAELASFAAASRVAGPCWASTGSAG